MLTIRGMYGLGDGVYMRPFVRAAVRREGEVALYTPWPELYVDLPVRCLKPETQLRTQAKNLARHVYADPPGGPEVRLAYTVALIEREGSILRALESQLPLDGSGFTFDLPDYPAPPIPSPYAVVRPCVVRREWSAPARNPRAEWVAHAARVLRERGYTVVSVADLDESEWAEPPLPEADLTFHGGELPVSALLGLIRHASLVVAPIGWALPVSMAYGTPIVVLAGGALALHGPKITTDPRIDTSRVEWILPDPACYCRNNRHECAKDRPDFERAFLAALERHERRLP